MKSSELPITVVDSFAEIRRQLEEREEQWLDARAATARHSRGRARAESEDDLRTAFQRDRDRITHTKAFRRLKHKTQVFVSPERDHYRTRLTHTLEVAQISRTVARALRLNEDLVEAIGLGHDLGHAPFGHVGEYALDEAYRRFDADAHFRHYEQSLRIVDELENNGAGLNLTWEVRDGILHHSKGTSDLMAGQSPEKQRKSGLPATLEGQVIRICDRVAYVNHDIDDAIRAGLIAPEDLPHDLLAVLGKTHSQRITTMVRAIIAASREANESTCKESTCKESTCREKTWRLRERIAMSDEVMDATDHLKNWMFDTVYQADNVDETPRVRTVIGALFERFMEQPALMHGDYASLCGDAQQLRDLPNNARARCVCDYIAGMTDRFASQTYAELFMPSSWRGV